MPRARTVLASVGAAAGLASCWWKADLIGDVTVHESTPQEAWVGQIILQAYHDDVAVRCLPQQELHDRLWPFYGNHMKEVQGFAAGWLSMIWLDRTLCDSLQRFGHRPSGDKEALRQDELKAIRALNHEYRHIAGTAPEGQADCEAVQTADKVIVALGTDPADVRLIHAWLAYYVTDHPAKRPEEYSLKSCYENGPWDLDPAKDGMFPKPVIESK